jgi:RNA polymerase sigma-70 factor (ECF subfamily)
MPPRARTPLPDLDADTATFEEWRSLLFGIAYRMLGSATDAEDVVQEACIRWLGRGPQPVESVRAYLVTIVTRLCLDQLDSARAQRETYAGPWLPEPVAEDDVATPLERATYLLHDVFGYSFDEVAVSLGRTPAACRQLGARARKHVDERRGRFDTDLQHGRELTDRFVTACATGDLSGLLAMLSEDVVVWTDGGGKARAALRPVIGPHRASRFLLNVAKKVQGWPRSVVLNGQPATVFVEDGTVLSALVLDILEGRIVGVRVVNNPDKLARLSAHLESLS